MRSAGPLHGPPRGSGQQTGTGNAPGGPLREAGARGGPGPAPSPACRPPAGASRRWPRPGGGTRPGPHSPPWRPPAATGGSNRCGGGGTSALARRAAAQRPSARLIELRGRDRGCACAGGAGGEERGETRRGVFRYPVGPFGRPRFAPPFPEAAYPPSALGQYGGGQPAAAAAVAGGSVAMALHPPPRGERLPAGGTGPRRLPPLFPGAPRAPPSALRPCAAPRRPATPLRQCGHEPGASPMPPPACLPPGAPDRPRWWPGPAGPLQRLPEASSLERGPSRRDPVYRAPLRRGGLIAPRPSRSPLAARCLLFGSPRTVVRPVPCLRAGWHQAIADVSLP